MARLLFRLFSLGLFAIASLYSLSFAQGDPHHPPGPDAAEGCGSPLRYGDILGPFSGGYNSHADAADLDGDGDLDLVIHSSLGGGAHNTFWGIHLYQTLPMESTDTLPRFAQPRKLLPLDAPALLADWDNDGLPDMIVANKWYRNLGNFHFSEGSPLVEPPIQFPDNVKNIIDWNGDGIPDLLASESLPGQFWPPASVWINGESPYTEEGIWKGGPLRGTLRHYRGTRQQGILSWEDAGILQAGPAPLEVYGDAHPTLADWDGDGDLDLLVGGHYNLTYFENIGTPQKPQLSERRRVKVDGAFSLRGIYIRPIAYPLDHDSQPDLSIAQESGEITFFHCLGLDRDRTPIFGEEQIAHQKNPYLDAGCLSTISCADWDNDGDLDLVSGNSYGEVILLRNGGSNRPWEKIQIPGIHIQAGPNGSIQGPNEAHYGYTCPALYDLNQDGWMDLVLSDVWGKHTSYLRNPRTQQLESGIPIQCQSPQKEAFIPPWIWHAPQEDELITQWRCQPAVEDWDNDGIADLITLDSQGYLALYRGEQIVPQMLVDRPIRAFLTADRHPIRITNGLNGRSGRARIVIADWDGDGDRDILRGCTHAGDHEDPHFADYERVACWYENTGDDRIFTFRGSLLQHDEEISFCGHATSPAVVDWDRNGSLDLLLGAEDGLIYFFTREFLDGTRE